MREVPPFGVIALVSLSVSAAAALALVVAALFARRSGATRATRALGVLVAVTFGLGAFAISRVIAEAHVEMLPPMPVPLFAKLTWGWKSAFLASRFAWQTLALALVVVAALSGTALFLVARRAGARRPFILATTIACAMGVVTGAGILCHFKMGTIWSSCEGDDIECIQGALQDARDVSSVARGVILGLAALGSGYFFVRSRRAPKEAVTRDPEALVALGAAVFAFGLAAWLGARGMAYDARHLVPAPEHDVYCTSWSGPPASSLPLAGPCDPGVRAPTLTLDVEKGLYLGYQPVELAELAEALRNLRSLSWGVSKDQVVLVGASADTPMATLLPILAAVEKDFGGQIALLRARPEQNLSTATLGEVSMQRRCCSHTLRMATNGAPLSTYTTWGDVARAMGEGAFFRLDP